MSKLDNFITKLKKSKKSSTQINSQIAKIKVANQMTDGQLLNIAKSTRIAIEKLQIVLLVLQIRHDIKGDYKYRSRYQSMAALKYANDVISDMARYVGD